MIFASLVLANFSLGQEPDPQRRAELERRVQELEDAVRRLQPAASSAIPTPSVAGQEPITENAIAAGEAIAEPKSAPLAGWKDGFFLQSPDKAYHLRITGQVQADLRNFMNGDDTTDIDTFLVRRARLGIEATVLEHFEFRLLPDFGQGKAVIQDSYLNIHYVDWLQVQVGKFKEPVSYEQLIQDRFVPTLERSLIDYWVPARDVGLMIHGQKLLGDRFDYAVGIFNGETNGDVDTNDAKDIAARIAVRPFRDPDGQSLLHGLQLGISGSTGVEHEPISPSVVRTPATVPWFAFISTVRANGLRNRWSPEISYFHRSLGFAAQYLRVDQEMLHALNGPGSTTVIDVPVEGYYFLLTYLLTGEERTTYSQAIKPLRPFDPHYPFSQPGAWEFVARVSHLRIGDEVFAPGDVRLADPKKYSSAATELTVGFNWYLNPWVRMQFNWEHARFHNPVLLGPASAAHPYLLGQDTLLTRLQVIF